MENEGNLILKKIKTEFDLFSGVRSSEEDTTILEAVVEAVNTDLIEGAIDIMREDRAENFSKFIDEVSDQKSDEVEKAKSISDFLFKEMSQSEKDQLLASAYETIENIKKLSLARSADA